MGALVGLILKIAPYTGIGVSPAGARKIAIGIIAFLAIAIIGGAFWYLRSLTTEIADLTAKQAVAEQTIGNQKVAIETQKKSIEEIGKRVNTLNEYYDGLKKYDASAAKKLAGVMAEVNKLKGIKDAATLDAESNRIIQHRIKCIEIASGKPNTEKVDCK